jgi:hypothetical protein
VRDVVEGGDEVGQVLAERLLAAGAADVMSR